MKTFLRFFVASAAILSALAFSARAQTYQITDLGPLNSAPTFATAISENGVIVGYSQMSETAARAWVWRYGIGMTDLGSFGGADSRAFAVGLDGRVYGYAQDAGGAQRGFVWENGVLADVGSLAPGDVVNVEAVNASGVLAGATTSGGGQLGFTLSGGTMTALPALAGAPVPANAAAYDINDAGRVAGVSGWIYGGTRAFRTEAGGVLVSLGTLGANDSTATAINAGGQVVGYSTAANNDTHAFIFNDGTGMTDLGLLAGGHDARAWGIDDAGDAVGTAENSAGQARAALWMAGGTIQDLNDTIPINSGWLLEEARDMNNSGDIVGFGTIGGQQHAFLLERFSGTDTFAPVAVSSVTVPTYSGTEWIPVAVSFWDNEKVVSATARAPGAVYLTGPNGFVGQGTVQNWTTNDSQRVNVTWIFNGPGGSWGAEDDGTYEVRVAPNQVSDLAGNKHVGGVIGTFVVGIQTTPTLTIAGLPTTTTAGTPVSLTVTATSSYPGAAGDVFAFAIDWDGDGTNVQTVNAVTNAVIAHTFTSTGTRTVRVHATDPHGVLSSERTASVTVTNNAAAFQLATVLDTPAGVSSYATVATVKNGTMYFFGTPNEAGTLATTWDYLTPGAGFVLRGDFDNGPIIPAGAGVDSRGRVVIFGGYEAGASATASGLTFAFPNTFGGGVAAMPAPTSTGPTTSDNLSRLYLLANPSTLYRYTAGASGNGTWATLPGPGVALACMSFDGADRIVGFAGTAVWAYSISGNAWTQLGVAPIAPTRAALGADGLVYLVKALEIWAFDPVLNTTAKIGVTNYDESFAIVLKGTDGFLYFIGGDSAGLEKFDTRAATTQSPVITSIASGTTLVQGTAWTYSIAASGKPRPTFSLTHAPAGMTVNAITGVIAWTPALAQVGAHTAAVRAMNSAGFAEQMITFNVLAVAPDITPPTAPARPVVFNLTTSSADISWTASTDNIGVTGYGVFERRSGGTRWRRTTYYAQIGTTTGTSWHTPTLPLCSSKTYYLAARDVAGNRSAYTPVSFTLLCAPSIGVSATGPGFPAGRWAIETEPFISNTFSGYGNPVPALTVASAPAGAAWHNVTASTGYFTWTPAVGQAGDVIFSVTATSTTGSLTQNFPLHVHPQFTDLIPPSPVVNLVADQVTGDSCRVTWGAATDNYGVTLYRVTAAHRTPRSRFHHGGYPLDQIVSVEIPGGTLQTVLTGLRPSTSFAVTVQARDAAGNWGYPSSAQITTLPQPFVLEDRNVKTTTNANGSTTLTWPGYGYYWRYTVQCTADLMTWVPVEPASQWPSFLTTFTFTPELGVPQRFYRVLATPASP